MKSGLSSTLELILNLKDKRVLFCFVWVHVKDRAWLGLWGELSEQDGLWQKSLQSVKNVGDWIADSCTALRG